MGSAPTSSEARVYVKSYTVYSSATQDGTLYNQTYRKFDQLADAVAFAREMERLKFSVYLSVDADVEGWEYGRRSRHRADALADLPEGKSASRTGVS